jgi:hypothetical protein
VGWTSKGKVRIPDKFGVKIAIDHILLMIPAIEIDGQLGRNRL